MKKLMKYLLLFITIITLSGCKSVEVVSISQNQEKITLIRNQILRQSIFDLNIASYQNIPLTILIGDSYENLDLLRNEIPYLSYNLNLIENQIHKAYQKSLLEIQEILLAYSEIIEYPLLYPSVESKYIIKEKSYSILFEQKGEELQLEIDNILETNLKEACYLYTDISTEYNIYCKSLEIFNRQTLTEISTYIMPRLKTLFIKKLMVDLNQNEEKSGFLNTPINPTTINITRE